MSLDPLLGSLMWEGGGNVTLTNDTRVEKFDSTYMQVTTDIGGGTGEGRTILIMTSPLEGAMQCDEWIKEIQRQIPKTTASYN